MKNRKAQLVYVIYNEVTGLTKIGVTANITTRKGSLQNACGVELKVVYTTLRMYNALKIERKIHDRFDKYRRIGEWFKIDYYDAIDYIKNISDKFDLDNMSMLYSNGYTVTQIAKQTGLSKQYVSKSLNITNNKKEPERNNKENCINIADYKRIGHNMYESKKDKTVIRVEYIGGSFIKVN